MKEFKLKNNISAVYKQNKNTPRIALSFNFSINETEKLPGIYCLMSRLFLQGTKTRSSEQLANELDENAIEFSCDLKQDYLRFRFVCLNEDVNLAINIMSDIIKNSTFEEFEKEKIKLQGEITAELDSTKTKALDNYYKTIFKNHMYGHTYTTILENLDKINQKDILNAYEQIISTSQKVLSVVGDIEFNEINDLLNYQLGDIKNDNSGETNITIPVLKHSQTVEIIKDDAQQAQIIQGWIVPTFDSVDYPPMILLNVILGSAGLSSRLFIELREKKGLAYTVRSTYETNKKCANFSIYIGTEPKNIQICLDGFKTELKKLTQALVGDIELNNAKNNIIGKQQFITETNEQQANLLAYYGIMQLGFDFQNELIEKIKQVTSEQLQECAKKYFMEDNRNNFVVSILRPSI